MDLQAKHEPAPAGGAASEAGGGAAQVGLEGAPCGPSCERSCERSAGPLTEAAALPTLSFVWAAVALLEKADDVRRLALPGVAMIGTALALLLFPRRPVAWAALLAATVADAVADLPGINNHQVLLGAFAIVASARLLAAWWRLRRDDRRLDLVAWTQDLAPAARVCLVVLYLAAAFHKLNTGFFDPSTSCFGSIYASVRHVLAPLPRPGPALVFVGAVGTLLVEVALGIGFLRFRRRAWPYVLGVAFHLVLCLGFADFALLTLGLYFVVLAGDRPRLAALAPVRAGPRAHLPAVGGLVLFVACGFYLPFLSTSQVWIPRFMSTERNLAGTAAGLALLFATLLVARAIASGAAPAGPFPPRGGSLERALALLLVGNALAPYTGLKTSLSLSMYSNLRTEGRSNHLLVGHDLLRIFPFADDLVTVEALTFRHDGRPIALARPGAPFVVPYQELRGHVRRIADGGGREIGVVYRRGGRREVARWVEASAALPRASWLASRLLAYRRVPARGDVCQW